MNEYIVVETVNAIAAGRFVALVKGEHVMLAADEVDDLLRAGYIEGTAVEPKMSANIETAALIPAETATAPAQRTLKRKA